MQKLSTLRTIGAMRAAVCWTGMLIGAAACSGAEAPRWPRLDGPREPPAAQRSIADEPYVQEINHRLLPGFEHPALAVFDGPIAVSADAIRSRDQVLFTPATGQIIAAAEVGELIYAATAAEIFRIAHDGTSSSTAAPPGTRALIQGSGRLLILAGDGLYAGEPPQLLYPGALAAHESSGTTWVATAASLVELDGSSGAELRVWPLPARVGRPKALLRDVSMPARCDLLVIGDAGLACLDPDGSERPIDLFAAERVPFAGAHTALVLSDGGFIAATPAGAMRVIDRGAGPEWRVYSADRWLPSPDVRAFHEGVQLWIATAAGLAAVESRVMTLEEKMSAFIERVVLRHDRDGAVADSHLTRRGDLTSNIPWDSDNDGSWTGYWLRAECHRFLVTGDPAARAHVDRSLEMMLRLRDLTGTTHFVARALIHKPTCKLDDCAAPDDGEWFTSPDGEWWVKGDTSNDEIIAHIAVLGEIYDRCADQTQRERIRDHFAGIIGGIIDHDYQLVDRDGAVTTYGQFDPYYVNESIPGLFGDGGLRASQLLAGLTLAHYLTGEDRFAEAKADLITRHNYAEAAATELERPARKAHMDNDEMGVWALMTLLRYEPDPKLYALWQEAWATQWDHKFDDQQAAWWDVVHAQNGSPNPPLERIRSWLQSVPVDMIRWTIDNTHRQDLIRAPRDYFSNEGRMRSDQKILPYDERPVNRWNTDSFHVQGGHDGWLEMDGADALAPYWIARSYGWLTATARE